MRVFWWGKGEGGVDQPALSHLKVLLLLASAGTHQHLGFTKAGILPTNHSMDLDSGFCNLPACGSGAGGFCHQKMDLGATFLQHFTPPCFLLLYAVPACAACCPLTW